MKGAASTDSPESHPPPGERGGHGARAASESAPRTARRAQPAWAETPLKERARLFGRLRRLLAREASSFARDLEPRHPAHALTAEVLPLADACAFLQHRAYRILAPKREGASGRPVWLSNNKLEVTREPLGVVLVVSPNNYPLLLPGVQALQALAAGNAVLVKPSPGCTAPLERLAGLLAEAGLPEGLFSTLGEGVEDARAAVQDGVDLAVLTGSAATGRALLADLAPKLTPSIVELSGVDAAFVLKGADPAWAARGIAFGLGLNGGATCIAPRRVFAHASSAPALEAALARELARLPPAPLPPRQAALLAELLPEAEAAGARFLPARPDPGASTVLPTLVAGADPAWRLLRADLFLPLAGLVSVADAEEALRLDRECPYALGASVWCDPKDLGEGQAFAAKVRAGCVTVNDAVAPTADPRLPFAPAGGESGFGVTRGAEGLLAMTRPKAVTVTRGRFRPHWEPVTAQGDPRTEAALAYLRLAHGTTGRLRALVRLVTSLAKAPRPKG